MTLLLRIFKDPNSLTGKNRYRNPDTQAPISTLPANGGGRRDRTDDPLLAKQVLSQLSYAPVCLGGSGWARTNDPRLIKTVL